MIMKYTVRVEREHDVISVVCDGTIIWSATCIDEKRGVISERVRNFNKYPTTNNAAKLVLTRAFPPAKVEVPWWMNRRNKKT